MIRYGSAVAKLVVYHNPSCGTARGVLELVRERGVDAEVIEYLKHPLNARQLRTIIDAIDVEPAELVRKDARFKELGLDAGDYVTKAQVVDLLVAHPELMQRPIAVLGSHTVLARPKEKIVELLDLLEAST